MKRKLFLVLAGMLFLTIGCAPTVYFGVPSKAITVPAEFGQTEAIVQKAEKSPGAQYCPDKVDRAKELGKKGIETYWACRTDEALGLLAESRKLAEEAMLCKASPKPAAISKPLDSDGDGVYDGKDQCPNTPKGVKVDSVGCPLDTDGDGIYDYKDRCPGTPTSATVDERGCWVLKKIYFETDKWNIKPQYYPILDEAVVVLRKNSYLKMEIQGNTDNSGSAEYNQILSENRAKLVMDYFIKAGIGSDRLTAKGYGLTKSAFPNTSSENMAKNRRVELKPLR